MVTLQLMPLILSIVYCPKLFKEEVMFVTTKIKGVVYQVVCVFEINSYFFVKKLRMFAIN